MLMRIAMGWVTLGGQVYSDCAAKVFSGHSAKSSLSYEFAEPALSTHI
ncbi:hypothetical protein K6Y31_19455 [Motilimonas cestriensis]|uniref:Uncharacterized protein n=1 Tax=Motilimonas cestriensis TaxID=2742685 RepID=A0ABS8WD33_9GAMM|nr:hypothetical protein [Motilimonas cestriensis]MCE2596956.1 hypothetical protein [Motilimonas cestriensis]